MGLCDPKQVRAGKAWYQVVNEPGFINGDKPGTVVSPTSARDNALSVNDKRNKNQPQEIQHGSNDHRQA